MESSPPPGGGGRPASVIDVPAYGDNDPPRRADRPTSRKAQPCGFRVAPYRAGSVETMYLLRLAMPATGRSAKTVRSSGAAGQRTARGLRRGRAVDALATVRSWFEEGQGLGIKRTENLRACVPASPFTIPARAFGTFATVGPVCVQECERAAELRKGFRWPKSSAACYLVKIVDPRPRRATRMARFQMWRPQMASPVSSAATFFAAKRVLANRHQFPVFSSPWRPEQRRPVARPDWRHLMVEEFLRPRSGAETGFGSRHSRPSECGNASRSRNCSHARLLAKGPPG